MNHWACLKYKVTHVSINLEYLYMEIINEAASVNDIPLKEGGVTTMGTYRRWTV